MKNAISLFLTAILAITVQGQTLYVGCYRSIDNARVEADSIRIVCPDLGIDSTVRGFAFTLPTPTAVEDEASESQAAVVVDMYDILGNYLGQTTSRANQDALQWDPTYGLVFVRVAGAKEVRTNNGKDAVEILASHAFTITAWRGGYQSTTVTRTVKYFDIEVPLVLELLPWWKRVVQVSIKTVARMHHIYSSESGRGHDTHWNSGTDTVEHDFSTAVWVMKRGADTLQKVWNWNDTAVSYLYLDMSGGYPASPVLSGLIVCDTVSGLVSELSISQTNGLGTGDLIKEVVKVQNLPSWSIVTPQLLDLHLRGKLANNCLDSISHFVEQHLGDGAGGSLSYMKYQYGPHVPSDTGIELSCTIKLLD